MNSTAKAPCGSAPQHFINQLDFLWLEITQMCNLRCLHCYAEASPSPPLRTDVRENDWIRILDEASRLGCRKVQFTGGEPTVHPAILPLLDHAASVGFSLIEIFTNATHLTDDLLQKCSKLGVQLAFSFYSPSGVVHDRITQSEGSFAKTVAGVERAIDYGITCRVGLTEMNQNSSEIESAIAFLSEIGISKVRVDRLRCVGRGTSSISSNDPYSQLCGRCWRGKLCVSHTGEVHPCVFARFLSLGHVSGGLARLLLKGELLRFRQEVFERAARSRCRHPGPDLVAGCDPDYDIDCGPDCNPGDKEDNCSPEYCCNPNEPDTDCSPREG